jgi:hypothetical protein
VSEADSGIASIALHFGAGAAIGEGAQDGALAVAGMPRRQPKPPVFPYPVPSTLLTGTTVGSFVVADFAPQSGWFADITMITLSGFTAGTVVATKGAPAVTAAGTPVAIEYVASFPAAGVLPFPQKGNPLLDANDLLYFTVTSALTAPNGVVITGVSVMVPVSRIDEYLS